MATKKTDLDQIEANERILRTLNTQLGHPGLDADQRRRIEREIQRMAGLRQRSGHRDRANFQ